MQYKSIYYTSSRKLLYYLCRSPRCKDVTHFFITLRLDWLQHRNKTHVSIWFREPVKIWEHASTRRMHFWKAALVMGIKKIFLWFKEIICLLQMTGCKEIISFIFPSNFFESKSFEQTISLNGRNYTWRHLLRSNKFSFNIKIFVCRMKKT